MSYRSEVVRSRIESLRQWRDKNDSEICAEVGDACSGGGLKVAEAVAEFNPLDDFRQAVLTENGGAKFVHVSGGMVLLRAA